MFAKASTMFLIPKLPTRWGPLSPGEQRSGPASSDPLHPRAGSSRSRASGRSDSGPGGIPQQEGGGPVYPGVREARPDGARGPDGLHTGAAEGDGRTLLRTGCQGHSCQVTHTLLFQLNCQLRFGVLTSLCLCNNFLFGNTD